MPKIKDFFAELKARNVRRTMAIYISTALTTIGILKLLAETYDFPTSIFPILVTAFIGGIGSAFTFGWFHGKEGTQPFQKRELFIHGLIAVLILVVSFRVGGNTGVSLLPLDLKVVAVLPFANWSDNKEDEYFSDGITEDILSQLSKIGDLRVISRTSVMPYKGTKKKISEIAHELGAGAILEGSVRRSGDRVRITGQLINAKTDEHIWGETYDRDMKDVFAIQSDVAQQIALGLRSRLSPQEQHRIEKQPTRNIDAYAYYLKGRDLYYHYRKEDNEVAIALFKQAISLDSNYASAFAGLADTYSQRVQLFGFPAEWLDSSLALSKKAIALDPNLAEPYKALGLASMKSSKYKEALADNEKALELNPNYADAAFNAGLVCTWMGKLDKAVPYIERGIQLEPLRPSHYEALALAYMCLAEDSLAEQYFLKTLKMEDREISFGGLSQLYMMRGEFNRALAVTEKGLQRFPGKLSLLAGAGEVELLAGEYAKASVYFEKALKQSSDEEAPTGQLGFLLQQQGKKDRARHLWETKTAFLQSQIQSGNEDPDIRFDLARIYAAEGKFAEAKEQLRQAAENGWTVYRWALLDPILENLRHDDEFIRIITSLKDKVADMRRRVRQQNRGTVL